MDDRQQRAASDFAKMVARHGHAFQYAVIRRADELFAARASGWSFGASEVPVEVNGHSTRIDFVLQRDSWTGASAYLVAECKRSNPSHSNWCFAKAPYTRRNSHSGAVVLERIGREADESIGTEARKVAYDRDVYGIAYEIRSGEKGEGPPGRGAIEEACGQLMKGMNGLVEMFARRPHLVSSEDPALLVPVLFTTASLWITDEDLAAADIASGVLTTSAVRPPDNGWLWYRYHASPGIVHGKLQQDPRADVGELVENRFARCIAVVSPTGIDDFLGTTHY